MDKNIMLVDHILQLCKERNISLAELERQSGINQRSIYRWNENVPSVDKVKRVADFFGVSVDDLLEGDTQCPE